MSAEQTVHDKSVQPNGALNFLKQVVALVLALAAMAGIFIVGTMYSDVAQSLSSEPVYEATPEQVNPALEGKLVKMRVTELVAEGGPVVDEIFGLREENTIALNRYYLPECSEGRLRVYYKELHGIRKALILAPDVKAGAYSLRARDSFWEDLGGEYLNSDEIPLPASWEGRVVSRTAHGITLRTDDTSNLATQYAEFKYMRIPSPWRGVRHMVGRQQGNVLDLTGEGCGLIRGEESYQQWSRMRPAVGLLLMPVWEYCFYILFLQGAITLCLLPGVLMMQKRGWLRAISFSFLLGILLSALVASAFLLLPYSEHNWMTWTYTLVPCLIALVLLWLACRMKR
ncbi:MAG: hypothetical protein IKZ07_09120 [Akkermansia sp.]|nr:hypothetical protein [Akkermansia sp.]